MTVRIPIDDFDAQAVIEEMRAEGKHVTIHHFRRYTHDFFPKLLNKGGKTVVIVMDEKHVGRIGTVHCYHKDSYCKKEGVKRALANLLGIELIERPHKSETKGEVSC